MTAANNRIMDEQLYQKAFSHFRNAEYEEAYNMLKEHEADMPPKARQLMKECRRLITDKYFYMIRECIDSGNTDKAQMLKSRYAMRYGDNPKVSGIKIGNAGTSGTDGEETGTYGEEPSALEKFYHSQAFVITVIVAAVVVIAIVIGSVKGCRGNSTSYAVAEDSTATDTFTVDTLADGPATDFERIKKKRGHFSVDIQWPVAMEGVDYISSLQQSITEAAFGRSSTDIEDCIERYFDDMESTADEYGGPSPCEGRTTVKFLQRLDNLYIFNTHYYFYGGCGTSSCIISADTYVHYDKVLGRSLKLSDIIDSKRAMLGLINDHIRSYSSVEVDTVESSSKYYELAKEVPERFIISPMGVSFTFSKYEVTPGAYGEPNILFSYDELDDVLTDGFKESIGRSFPRNIWVSCKLTGSMINHEGNNPISLKFERRGDKIRNCVYTNELIGGKIKMRAEYSGDYILFSGKDGKYDFDIIIDRHTLEGKATDGPKVLDIYLHV